MGVGDPCLPLRPSWSVTFLDLVEPLSVALNCDLIHGSFDRERGACDGDDNGSQPQLEVGARGEGNIA
jgi:hypothetical protein